MRELGGSVMDVVEKSGTSAGFIKHAKAGAGAGALGLATAYLGYLACGKGLFIL